MLLAGCCAKSTIEAKSSVGATVAFWEISRKRLRKKKWREGETETEGKREKGRKRELMGNGFKAADATYGDATRGVTLSPRAAVCNFSSDRHNIPNDDRVTPTRGGGRIAPRKTPGLNLNDR